MEWVKQFTDMIFPINIDMMNIEGAYNLKNQYLPKSVFKYREVNKDSIKNLEEDTVWLADPGNLNDPYDCAHTIDDAQIQKKMQSQHCLISLCKKKDVILILQTKKRILLQSAQTPIVLFLRFVFLKSL